MVLMVGENCTVRTARGKVVYHCEECGKIMRYMRFIAGVVLSAIAYWLYKDLRKDTKTERIKKAKKRIVKKVAGVVTKDKKARRKIRLKHGKVVK